MNFAYEKEIYERWLTIYPLMEAGIVQQYVSFKDYKDKIYQQAKVNRHKDDLSNEQIIKHSMEIVKAYEKSQQKAGVKNGNI